MATLKRKPAKRRTAARKTPTRRPAAKMAKRRKRVAPCKTCAGFTVPSRKVPSVARNAKGQFAKKRTGRLGIRL